MTLRLTIGVKSFIYSQYVFLIHLLLSAGKVSSIFSIIPLDVGIFAETDTPAPVNIAVPKLFARLNFN